MKKKSKKNRVDAEQARLFTIFEALDANQLQVVQPVIEQAAFLRVELEDLQLFLSKNGWTCEYKNGENQWGTKISPESETYNKLKKQFDADIFKLAEMAPPAAAKDALEEFLGG